MEQYDEDEDFVFLDSVHFTNNQSTDQTLESQTVTNNNFDANPTSQENKEQESNFETLSQSPKINVDNTNADKANQQNQTDQKQEENLKDYLDLTEIEKKGKLYLLQIITMKIYHPSI